MGLELLVKPAKQGGNDCENDFLNAEQFNDSRVRLFLLGKRKRWGETTLHFLMMEREMSLLTPNNPDTVVYFAINKKTIGCNWMHDSDARYKKDFAIQVNRKMREKYSLPFVAKEPFSWVLYRNDMKYQIADIAMDCLRNEQDPKQVGALYERLEQDFSGAVLSTYRRGIRNMSLYMPKKHEPYVGIKGLKLPKHSLAYGALGGALYACGLPAEALLHLGLGFASLDLGFQIIHKRRTGKEMGFFEWVDSKKLPA